MKTFESDNSATNVNTPYFERYIDFVRNLEIDQVFHADSQSMARLFDGLTDADGLKAYAPNKWTVKQVIAHFIDTERIFATRALMIARGEQQNIAGYDHELYAGKSDANSRTIVSLKTEYSALRHATKALYESFNEAQLNKTGTVNGHKISVRTMAYIIPGHVLHHLKILKDNYGLEI